MRFLAIATIWVAASFLLACVYVWVRRQKYREADTDRRDPHHKRDKEYVLSAANRRGNAPGRRIGDRA